jgi:hypothetical protein
MNLLTKICNHFRTKLMKIYYDLEATSELEIDENNNSSIETHAGYTSFILYHRLGYCCNDLEDTFLIDLEDPEYFDYDDVEVMKEPNVVFIIVNSIGHTKLGDDKKGFKFCPFCGEKFNLQRIHGDEIKN